MLLYLWIDREVVHVPCVEICDQNVLDQVQVADEDGGLLHFVESHISGGRVRAKKAKFN
jgi:hypothetical protein